MKSIFLHFSIPGSIYFTQNQEIINNSEKNLNSYCIDLKLIIIYLKELVQHPLSFINIFGSSILFCIGIFSIVFLLRVNLLRKTPKDIILNIIFNHFKEVHNNLYSININNKYANKSNFKISNLLVYLFLSLAFINLGGMIHGTWCITTWFSATIGLSLIIWISTWLIRMYNYTILFSKNIHLNQGEELIGLAGFFPSGTPLWLAPLMVIIEILSWIIRFLSMGLRIAGNIVAGHVILGILSFAYLELYKLIDIKIKASNVSLSIIIQMAYIILTYFELAVAVIQAYVLTLLTSTFLKEVEEIH